MENEQLIKNFSDKASDPEDKILLRVAYSIWSGRHWMTGPQAKKRKII